MNELGDAIYYLAMNDINVGSVLCKLHTGKNYFTPFGELETLVISM